MSSEIVADNSKLAQALAVAGKDQKLRNVIFEALRQAELDADDPTRFREQVRWPLILSLLSEAKTHSVTLENGLIFELALRDFDPKSPIIFPGYVQLPASP